MVEFHVLSDIEILSQKAADIFIGLSRHCIALKKKFMVAVSGGSTPKRLYELLGSEPYSAQVDWRYLHFFWVDERFVPCFHEESNFRLLHDNLLSRITIPQENIHPVRTDLPTPQASARYYEEELKNNFGLSECSFPQFDLILLGIGEDGHTASLFPKNKSLKEKGHIAVPVIRKKPDHHRVTLTLPVINNAGKILFLVSGKNKAEVVKIVMEKKDPSYPASLVKPKKGMLVFLMDKEAGLYVNT